jgi:electron transport complex protein RnfD
MMKKRLVVSASPHIRHGRTVRSMMLTAIAALAPAAAWGLFQFGLRAFFLMEIGILTAVAMEHLICKLQKRPTTVGDFHAVLVGLTLALLVPAGAPWWLVFVGAALAILIGKAVFGVLGGSPISPALIGLLIVAASWPSEINSYMTPQTAPESLKTEAAAPLEAPLNAVATDPSDIGEYNTVDLFLGKQAGPIGAVSPVLLIIGGLFLIWRRVARWQAPLGFILGLGIAAVIGHATDPWGCAPAAFHLFTGAAMFAAFFLCTDWTSTPVTPVGMFLFGLLAGGLTLLLRLSNMPYGPEPWSVVIVSLTTPLLDRIALKPFGKTATNA